MKSLVYYLILCWVFMHTARAQQALGVVAIDQFVTAVNKNSLDLLQPYLTSETRVDALPAAYTTQILTQLLPQFGHITQVRLLRQEPQEGGTRYVCALTRKGAEKECVFLLTPAGKILEINLKVASAKKIDTASSPLNLITPPLVEAPMKLLQGLVLVEAEVDNRRGTFILDSGSPGVKLNKAQFITPASQTAVAASGSQGVNGSLGGMSYYVIGQFDWAGIQFKDKEVVTIDLSALEKSLGGVPLLGIIGVNIFNQYALTLNYHAARVEMRKPGVGVTTPAPLFSLPFTLRGHLPVIQATANGQVFQVAVDCGAQANLLDQSYAALFAKQLRKPTSAVLHGADTNSRTVVKGEVPELQLVGGLKFTNQQTVFSDISHLNQAAGSVALQGLVGYPFLSQYRTTIDYVNKQLYFAKW